MYTIAFVDDETLVRAGLRAAVDWSAHGFEVTGDYSSAEEALVAVSSNPTDVLFVDIMMPGMDGITLIERLHEVQPDTLSVVLTSFGEFSYAQRALRSGARDYLLKSAIDEQRLTEVMAMLKDELDARGMPRSREANNRDKGIRYLFESSTDAALSPDVRGDLPPDAIPLRIVLIVPGSDAGEVPVGTATSVTSLVRPVFESAPYARVIDTGDRTIGAFLKVADETLHSMLDAVRRTIRLHANLDARITAVQPVSGDVGQIDRSLARLRAESVAEFYRGPSADAVRIVRSDSDPRQRGPASIENPGQVYDRIDARLSGLLTEAAATGFHNELTTLIAAGWAKGIPPVDFKEMLYALATGMYRSAHGLDSEFPVVPSAALHRNIRESAFARGATMLLEQVFQAIAETLQERMQHDRVPVVTRARAYIARHYTRALPLDEIARECSVNPSYLSRVFHQTTGATFTDYVNRLRVDRAKELLLSRPGVFVYEIAQELGFEDSAYFSRLFREFAGTTPGAWRKSHES
ncbi:MAG: helix-turn-helix domain-containing protein [Spirochaetaceae bacterium]|nr:MAG: helix-turn-helix domain-containing protein [Spirochaetaceae bacterium]